ncbi:hypothetical protein N656DRAFT_50574 [Canariomyces notabilis]|uniref:TIL domain-containing protein n=1 Tax=Canariomyces notabilis TaxID=2074819 RepID=A0AAN6TN93_9PEZI|nr:hypothetical protein N656DRAFT_50574 [Canariomyces arenarius]
MKAVVAALFSLISLALAQGPPASCPTATRTIQNRGCRNECPLSDCAFRSTIRNPCGCPSTVPTATLIAPCEAECPYQGCEIEFRTSALPCAATSTSTRRWPPRPTTTTSTSTTPTGIITSIVTLPPRTSSTPCPKITRTTSPEGCPAIRCPVPTCRATSSLVIPCGCQPSTVLYVKGCETACPDGCLTRTETISRLC